MELISKMADYAVTLMVAMAAEPNSRYSAQTLAEKTALPRPTVGNLMKKLAAAGLLTSERGVKGGYGLAVASQKINVVQIITAIDGKLGFTACSHDDGDSINCARAGICATRPHWQTLSRAITQALAQVTLADMAQSFAAGISLDFRAGIGSDDARVKPTTPYEAIL
ncbi:MAG: SUF system Fe-S cluster assembly regulator [Candidatus Symbiobacter sp.]|nr:SUF system Fe-S cluster assembly regulator [Candidatus Symbiobacter sp.]